MIIALFPNRRKEPSYTLAMGILEFLTDRKVTVVVEDEEAKELGAKPLSSVAPSEITYAISMGGDGTILRLIHQFPEIQAPFLGINLGHLGFMADVPIPDLYPSLQDLLDGKFSIEERIVLAGEGAEKEPCFAINDIVLHRGSNPNLVEIAIHAGGVYLNTFEADGIIVATPNGSTAYSLAAGGPILSPRLEAIVITPISPHTISNRPIVLTCEEKIELQYLSHTHPLEVRADGLTPLSLKTGEVFHIHQSKKKFRLVSLHRRDYFSTLRTKLGWAGKLR